tara:strand:+ start:85 stop:531 length:447 start_codon:yes stop_codon:yes gene_type:complete
LKALLQRVSSASVTVEGQVLGSISNGLVILLGIQTGDSYSDIEYVTNKSLNLRIFDDDSGKFNYSLLDIKAEVLLISQFTLCSDTKKGRRPSFIGAAPPSEALELFNKSLKEFKKFGVNVQTGKFQSHMALEINNDGPVTIMLDSKDK